MPSDRRVFSVRDAEHHVRERCWAPTSEGRTGVEVEWFPVLLDHPWPPPPFDAVRSAAETYPLPSGGTITFEPGGQLEISSLPFDSVAAVCAATAEDVAALERPLLSRGIGLVGTGMRPGPIGDRVVRGPRYDAMEAYFDAGGPAGRAMMRATASVQVSVDSGRADEQAARWRLAHALGPVLAAAFSNSPLSEGRATGYRSTRLAVWRRIDRSRTAPPRLDAAPADGWVRYALAARVMLVRRTPRDFVPITAPLAFGEWISRGHELGFPTEDDFAYHLTTLFPPVRPLRRLELRMIDALPDPWWRVAVAVAASLLQDGEAAERASQAAAPAAGLWAAAARDGLSHPVLAAAARECFDAALDALGRSPEGRELMALTARYAERYVDRGRSPADDVLDARRRANVQAPVGATARARPDAW